MTDLNWEGLASTTLRMIETALEDTIDVTGELEKLQVERLKDDIVSIYKQVQQGLMTETQAEREVGWVTDTIKLIVARFRIEGTKKRYKTIAKDVVKTVQIGIAFAAMLA